MTRSAIDFGIDLGTTNSAIAVSTPSGVEIIKNNDSMDYTPSAIWIDKSDRLYVGRAARQHLDDDPANAVSEFKLRMGFGYVHSFVNGGRRMKPEEMSAEVLKSLRSDAFQRLHEDIDAAVITIPAAFEANQREATERAAQLAGLVTNRLLQEPVAAALAYTDKYHGDRAYWLIYDFGGGTFDAAAVRLEDGNVSVVNHAGDNNLGGKLIDWAIVEELFIPTLTRQAQLSDFRRGNPIWRSAVAKLKQDAENVKIRLSREETVTVLREFLCFDDSQRPVSFEMDVRREDVERLAEPFIVRTINICERALSEKSLKPSDIQKIVLVGGPTLMPYLRGRLESRDKGLGIPLEFRVDPLTVVAQGAALFASTQRLQPDEVQLQASRDNGVFTIAFPSWRFRGTDTKPYVAGIVTAPPGQQLGGATVQFQTDAVQPGWMSGQISVAPNGAFTTELYATGERTNTYQMILRDATGYQLPIETSPAPLTYVIGAVIDRTLLTHSIGVALAHQEVSWFLEKGAQLPARGVQSLRTAYGVAKGDSGSLIRVPVLEGSSPRADRNNRIGTLEIRAEQLLRDLPIGSIVDVTLEADISGLVHMTAYIPVLGDTFTKILRLDAGEAVPAPTRLREDLQHQLERLERLTEIYDPHVQEILREIEDEQIVHQVEVEIVAAQVDLGLAPAAQKRLQALATALDRAEDSAEWPLLVTQAENMVANAQMYLRNTSDPLLIANLQRLESEIHVAINNRDSDTLSQRTRVLTQLIRRILDKADILPQHEYQYFVANRDKLTNHSRADELIKQGRAALEIGDFKYLRSINAALNALWPNDQPPPDEGTLIRGTR